MFSQDGTAQGVAKQRMIESLATADKRLVHDPLAERFVLGAKFIKLMGHRTSVWLTQQFAPGFHQHLIARTRFIDEFVLRCTTDQAQAVSQYVILGAGYDTRAHRLALPDSVQVFEVDQAAVQARKRAKLPPACLAKANLHYVALDFNQQTLNTQLLQAGFKPNQATVFTLEGVSQYISKAALATTLAALAKLCGEAPAQLALSYVDAALQHKPAQCFGKAYPKPEMRAKLIQNLAAKTGEPWISFYQPSEISAMLADHGFQLYCDTSLAALNSQYFAAVGRALPERHIFRLENFVLASLN
ncbi:MAG: class I SAM-dependent methyltransferase [Pseudomonadales bacterium]|nr:class I SAM-dependent methyltransferase [Pseudomonadales bacterium]